MICCTEAKIEEIESEVYEHFSVLKNTLGSDDSVASSTPNLYSVGSQDSRHYEVAMYLFEKDKHHEAILCFKSALVQDDLELNERSNATFLCGVSFQAIGDVKMSKKFYLKTLVSNECHFLAAYNLGVLYLAEGSSEKAAQAFLKAHLVDSQDCDTLLNLAICHTQSEAMDDAVRLLKCCLEINDQCIPALLQLATIFHNKEMFQKSKHFFEKVLVISPLHGDALIGLGNLYLDQADNLPALSVKRNYTKAALHCFLTARDKGELMEEDMRVFVHKSIEFLRTQLQLM